MKILGKLKKLDEDFISGISDCCYCVSKLRVHSRQSYAQFADMVSKQKQISRAVTAVVTSNGDQKKHFVSKFEMLHITPILQIEASNWIQRLL